MFAHSPYEANDALIGPSPAIQRICDQLQRAALTEVPVLITGESGTGKELAAMLLHRWSARRAHYVLKVSCPSITDHIFAGELLRGVRSPAGRAIEYTSGACVEADHGTLFLDEIGELDIHLQPKFVCALQDCREARLGSAMDRAIDIRLICATNRDLEGEIVRGRFRSDLFHRINVIRIQMPALRERTADIPMLMEHFIRIYALQFGGRPTSLGASFLRKLSTYHWPGNVRELENMAKRYVLFGGEEHVVSALQQPEEFRPLVPFAVDLTTPLRVQTKRALQHLEKTIILGVLEAHRWNRRKTAQSLDISYRALLYKIKEVGLPRASPAPQSISLLPPVLPAKSTDLEDLPPV